MKIVVDGGFPGPYIVRATPENNMNANDNTYPAHAIKPGDEIDGIVVFDLARKGFGMTWYIPMVDGSRITVRDLDTLITIDD